MNYNFKFLLTLAIRCYIKHEQGEECWKGNRNKSLFCNKKKKDVAYVGQNGYYKDIQRLDITLISNQGSKLPRAMCKLKGKVVVNS